MLTLVSASISLVMGTFQFYEVVIAFFACLLFLIFILAAKHSSRLGMDRIKGNQYYKRISEASDDYEVMEILEEMEREKQGNEVFIDPVNTEWSTFPIDNQNGEDEDIKAYTVTDYDTNLFLLFFIRVNDGEVVGRGQAKEEVEIYNLFRNCSYVRGKLLQNGYKESQVVSQLETLFRSTQQNTGGSSSEIDIDRDEKSGSGSKKMSVSDLYS